MHRQREYWTGTRNRRQFHSRTRFAEGIRSGRRTQLGYSGDVSPNDRFNRLQLLADRFVNLRDAFTVATSSYNQLRVRHKVGTVNAHVRNLANERVSGCLEDEVSGSVGSGIVRCPVIRRR